MKAPAKVANRILTENRIIPPDLEEINPYMGALNKYGITLDTMAEFFAKELNAKVTKHVKVKKGFPSEDGDQDTVELKGKGTRIVAETGQEAVLQWEEEDNRIQLDAGIQCARMLGMFEKDNMQQSDQAIFIVEGRDEEE